MATTIDCTPTWQGLIPAFIAVLQDGSNDGRKIAKEELTRMAIAADKYNEMINNQAKRVNNTSKIIKNAAKQG